MGVVINEFIRLNIVFAILEIQYVASVAGGKNQNIATRVFAKNPFLALIPSIGFGNNIRFILWGVICYG